MSRQSARTRLQCESLEARENPSTLLSDTFDTVTAPRPVFNWQTWGNGLFFTSRLNALSGLNSLSTDGTAGTTTRTWNTAELPVDADVSVGVLSNNPAPLVVFARGKNLTTPQATYIGARLGILGDSLELISFEQNEMKTLARLALPALGIPGSVWFTMTVKPRGEQLSVVLQRQDDGRFLSSQGAWQTGVAVALTAATPMMTGTAQVGLARAQGGAGQAFFDNFLVATPAVEIPLPPLAPPVPEPPTPPLSSVPEPIRENFEQAQTNALPAGWQNFTTQPAQGFRVTTARPLDSKQGLQAAGLSNTTARTWYNNVLPADSQASVSLFADSLIPGTVFLRGNDLATAKPNYYGLTVVRGVEARLVAVVDGVSTTIGSIRSKNYVSGVWLRLSLTAEGDTLRAVVSRVDNGQFLTSDGNWSELPQPALEVKDAKLTTGGYAGLARPAQFAGLVSFDDAEFRAFQGQNLHPLTISASQPGEQFSGVVTFEAKPQGNPEAIRYLEFRLNGMVRSSAFRAPASWTLDTSLIPNGNHELTVRAIDSLGNPVTSRFSFTTANTNATPPRAEFNQKLPHIRIAQLAYASTPYSEFEANKLASSVDLVIPNPRFVQRIDAASPDTQQLLYTNISNLYGSLLLDWLNYADKAGTDREAAFYHVPKATAWQGSSPSSVPVHHLWAVTRVSTQEVTDLTSAARGGRHFGVQFGATGSTMNFGYPEKFFELNFDLARASGTGWQGVWEYPTATDAQGQPSAWKPLPITNDGTANLKTSGRISFQVPQDWVTLRVGNNERLFTVRLRTTSGTTAAAPEAKTIFGRDYLNTVSGNKGFIPAFDFNADLDGDGFLNDAEYARRADGKEARFAYESRLLYPYYGPMRFVTNPSSLATRDWLVEYHQRLLAANPLYDGLFLDNSNGRLPFGNSVMESTVTYGSDYADLLRSVLRGNPGKLIFTNTAGGGSDATPVTAASTGVLEEFLLRATQANWANFTDVANLVQARLNADTPSPYVILDSHPGHGFEITDDRVRSGTLAYYYLVADPERTMLMFFGGHQPSASWQTTWIPAAEVDIGKPTEEQKLFASGQDPQNLALEYRVYARAYEQALVLYKPRSYRQGVGTGSAEDATATTHQLGGNYRVLLPNGKLGPIVSSITLRNGEGVTLIKA